ncbi:MAG: hypothetical protein ACTHNS_09140 [Marmoricola sp.]
MLSLRGRRPAGPARPSGIRTVDEPAFGPTSGTVSGWFGIVLALVVLVVALTDPTFGDTVPLVLGALLAISLVWAVLLRPRVVLRRGALLLRNGFLDTAVPYGLIDRVTVRSATHVFVGERRYVGNAVGRSTLRMVRDERRPSRDRVPPGDVAVGGNLPDFLEQQVADRIRDAARGEGRVQRSVAWPEVAAVVALAAALALALAL